MYKHLKALGIENPAAIDRFTLRNDAEGRSLKIYFQKSRGDFFAKSVKFKYPPEGVTREGFSEQAFQAIFSELETICGSRLSAHDLNHKILGDLAHLEKVVKNKLGELEEDIKELMALTRK